MALHKVLRSPRLLRRKRRAQRKKSIALILLAGGIAGGALYLLTLPAFSITDIDVVGESPVPTEQIASLVKQELSGRYLFSLPKSNVFFYPRHAIEETLRVRFPVLENVAISLRNLGSVRVSLSPRRRVAEWCVADAAGSREMGCFFVDKTGFAFDTLPDAASSLYPRFHARTATTSSPLGATVLKEERLGTLLSLLQRLEALGLEALEADLFAGGEIALRLRNGGKILLREDGDFSGELSRLEVLLAEKNLVPRSVGEGLRVEYIDLRYGNKIYFK